MKCFIIYLFIQFFFLETKKKLADYLFILSGIRNAKNLCSDFQ